MHHPSEAQSRIDESPESADDFAALAQALKVLDGVLAIAVDKQARLLGPATLLDPWRGMHLEQADVERLLKQSPHLCLTDAARASVPEALAASFSRMPRVAALAHELRLSATDLAALLILLAPDVDLRYERIYAYLQDDIARKRPSLDLIANLLARDTVERLAVCTRFGVSAPLRSFGLVLENKESEAAQLATPLRVDVLWRKWLLNEDGMGDVGCNAELLMPAESTLQRLCLEPSVCELIEQVIAARNESFAPVRIHLRGPHGSGKYLLAHTIAHATAQKLLVYDLRECERAAELRRSMARLQRAGVLFNAILYIHGVGQIEQRDPQLLRALIEALAETPNGFILSSTAMLPPVFACALSLLRVQLNYPSGPARSEIWTRTLAEANVRVGVDAVERIASRFALCAPQIHQAVTEAVAATQLRANASIGYEELASAARLQCGTELGRIAQKITPRATFSALVVPREVDAQLREICTRIATRDAVAREWAGGSVHARVMGVTALFVGPSGTGKTLSAEALACELGLDMYRIDLAGIVSKYIGETEKNLDRVFAAAEHANAVLFFDEADALFGKRSEVKDAHDRYANIEVAYLLQKMEQFDGLAILATNLKQNLDEAFARRLTFTVNFPFPEAAERHKLWEQLWPPRAPRHADVDLDWFAREFRLSGGNIRNTVLAAAHLAAADGKVITREHLLHATRREFQKLGKNLVHPAATERRLA
ncbi:MAG TPA: ATP-binding protein [Steroidobacteraceae bacterium]|nr:ATP-binding protein [Steroidobacteraceae bacterium]